MRLVSDGGMAGPSGRDRHRGAPAWMLVGLLLGALVAPARGLRAASETVTIVLPPKLMAGHPATLAVLGVDGRLAPAFHVELGDGQTITTDRTGRAVFHVPATGDYLLAKGSGAEAAALIDPAVAQTEPSTLRLPPIVSLNDRFWICGGGLRGNADEDSVELNGQSALVLASSPICLVAWPGNAQPGRVAVSVEAPGVQWKATTTLVSLQFSPPNPPLSPGQQGQLVIRTLGTNEKLEIVAQNHAPGVLRFVRGDTQELMTGGGPENLATMRVEAISSGDFSFSARVRGVPDLVSAERYLRAAVPLAPKDSKHRIAELARQLAEQHSRDVPIVRAKVAQLARGTMAGDFQTLLEAAEAAL